jgi:hypothetical protein
MNLKPTKDVSASVSSDVRILAKSAPAKHPKNNQRMLSEKSSLKGLFRGTGVIDL